MSPIVYRVAYYLLLALGLLSVFAGAKAILTPLLQEESSVAVFLALPAFGAAVFFGGLAALLCRLAPAGVIVPYYGWQIVIGLGALGAIGFFVLTLL